MREINVCVKKNRLFHPRILVTRKRQLLLLERTNSFRCCHFQRNKLFLPCNVRLTHSIEGLLCAMQAKRWNLIEGLGREERQKRYDVKYRETFHVSSHWKVLNSANWTDKCNKKTIRSIPSFQFLSAFPFILWQLHLFLRAGYSYFWQFWYTLLEAIKREEIQNDVRDSRYRDDRWCCCIIARACERNLPYHLLYFSRFTRI